MAEPFDVNSYKALATAAALGLATGAGGTYTVSYDYNRDITAIKVEAARNECRLGLLWENLGKAR